MKKKLCLVLALPVFSVFVLFWIFYVPNNPDRLFRMIPKEARAISVHEDVGGRLPDILANPVVAELLSNSGQMDASDLSSEQLEMLDKYVNGRILVGQADGSRLRAQPYIFFGAWIGSKSTLLHFVGDLAEYDGLEKLKRYNGRDIWKVSAELTGTGMPLYLSVIEGAVIGCLSTDEVVHRYLLDIYDGRVEGAGPKVLEELYRNAALEPQPDMGWMNGSIIGLDDSSSWAVSNFSESGMTGKIVVPMELPESNSEAGDLSPVRKLFGDHPIAVASLSGSVLAQKNAGVATDPISPVVLNILNQVEPEEGYLACFGGDKMSTKYQAGSMGFNLPTVMVALRFANEVETRDKMAELIEAVNAVSGWGLVPSRRSGANGADLFVIEGENPSPYAEMQPATRVCYLYVENWVFICANRTTLLRLQMLSAKNEGIPAWEKALNEQPGAAAFWLNLRTGGKDVRSAVATYFLSMSFGGDPDQAAVAQEIFKQTKKWTKVIAPLEEFVVWTRGVDDQSEISFRMGK